MMVFIEDTIDSARIATSRSSTESTLAGEACSVAAARSDQCTDEFLQFVLPLLLEIVDQ
jgi:hypothetical protein